MFGIAYITGGITFCGIAVGLIAIDDISAQRELLIEKEQSLRSDLTFPKVGLPITLCLQFPTAEGIPRLASDLQNFAIENGLVVVEATFNPGRGFRTRLVSRAIEQNGSKAAACNDACTL
jgi:hypothetical protein